MEYLIIYHHQPIGRIKEPQADQTMGVIFGSFVPFPGYEQVRPIFQRFANATAGTLTTNQKDLERFYQERDSLNLSIVTITGLPVETQGILIRDYSADFGDSGYEAEFCVAYADGRFFSTTTLWDS